MEAVEIRDRDAFEGAVREIEGGNAVVVTARGLTLDEEVRLKRLAFERGGLVLGPGCSCSHLEGSGFGIWNSVKSGPVGIISTGGSGIREMTSLLQSIGVSSSLCVGHRDLSQKVGGLGTIMSLRYLSMDPDTEVIVLSARTPPASVAKRIMAEIMKCEKKVVLCFIGEKIHGHGASRTFEEAAEDVFEALNLDCPFPSKVDVKAAGEERSRFGCGQKYVRGLFCGGMLCLEAQAILGEHFAAVYSNVPLSPRRRLPDPRSSKGHACADMGDPELSPVHPAVDPSAIGRRILREARDWETAVILLDVVLGNGAHPDPAGELLRAIEGAKEKMEETGGHLSIAASVVGTREDPQGLLSQKRKLEGAGVMIMPSSTSAARLSAKIAGGGL
ncbi:MAG: hypothetical protein QW567_00620 [Candidatus Hadarchaeales archaeon]